MKRNAWLAFLLVFIAVLCLPFFGERPSVKAEGPKTQGGLLERFGEIESDFQTSKSILESAVRKIDSGDLQSKPVPLIASAMKPAKQVPRNMATAFEWECPEEFEEHSQHVFTIVTDAKFIDPIVEDGFDEISLHGPVITENDPESGLRELSYSWTAPPNDTGYGVEVITFDPDRGLQRHRQRVTVLAKDPPPPDPNPPGGGFGLAGQVPAWLATVPAADRGNATTIKAALFSSAANAGNFQTVAEIEAATMTALSKVIVNGSAWQSFGQKLDASLSALKSANKITTPSQYAQAIMEIGGAL